MSSFTYTLNHGALKADATIFAVFMLNEADTTAVGMRRQTSSAWLGPETIARFAFFSCSSTSSITSDIVMREWFSIPFATFTIIVFESS